MKADSHAAIVRPILYLSLWRQERLETSGKSKALQGVQYKLMAPPHEGRNGLKALSPKGTNTCVPKPSQQLSDSLALSRSLL